MSFDKPSSGSLSLKGRVCTLGMIILDHFEVEGEGDSQFPIDAPSIGGGGIYAMTGARLFLPPSHCGMLIDEGSDFPPACKRQLAAMGDMTWFRPREGRTTRALNVYSTNTTGEGHQSFRYISPQLQLPLKDLILPPSPFATPHPPEWVHVVVRIPRARDIVAEAKQIESTGIEGHGKGWKPKMIWEPLDVKPENAATDLVAWLELAPHFNAISPNLVELQTVLGHPTTDASIQATERAAGEFCSLFKATEQPVLVLRAGALGCFTICPTWRGWTPAYWTTSEQDRVIDPTGGGNAFLGGLCAGLLLTDDWRKATMYASVAASFAIQQRGLPMITSSDTWNGENPWTRLQTLIARTLCETSH